jgi:hypothetical protein
MVSEFVKSQDEPSAAKEQTPLSKEEQAQISAIRDLEAEFIALCHGMGSSRHTSLAITYIENASLRAQRHVTSKRERG